MTLQEQLEKLGLNQKAAQTYLAALELGSAPVQEIAKKAGLSRTSIYPQIEELIKLGLATTVERGKKTFYSAEPPRQLDLLLRRQELDLNARRDELLKILPEFEALYNLAPEKPTVKFYEGKEGLIALREDLLNDRRHKEFLSFTALDDFQSGLPQFEKEQSDRRATKNFSWLRIKPLAKSHSPKR